jgi:hypothetical protein
MALRIYAKMCQGKDARKYGFLLIHGRDRLRPTGLTDPYRQVFLNTT